MQVINLTEGSREYTSNVWHISGDYHVISDNNTLIDTGRDYMLLDNLETLRCGLGKRSVEQIILTHSHFDHAGLLNALKDRYHPPVYAHPLSRIDNIIPLSDRNIIKVGDKECLVVYVPGHSDDSICILCEEEHILFSGDCPMRIYSGEGEFNSKFVEAFELFVSSDIQTIYPGHGNPIQVNVPHLLDESFSHIRKGRVV